MASCWPIFFFFAFFNLVDRVESEIHENAKEKKNNQFLNNFDNRSDHREGKSYPSIVTKEVQLINTH